MQISVYFHFCCHKISDNFLKYLKTKCFDGHWLHVQKKIINSIKVQKITIIRSNISQQNEHERQLFNEISNKSTGKQSKKLIIRVLRNKSENI